MSATHKNLEEFLGSYFHQDWMEDGLSSLSIVEKYLSEWPLDEAKAALQELHDMLSIQNDAELKGVVNNMGCYFNPGSEGYASFSDWMNAVEKAMSRALK